MAKKQKKVKKKAGKKPWKKERNICPSCSIEETKTAEDMVRDIINFVNVKRREETEGIIHKIEPETAEELVEMLEELAGKVAGICR